MNLSDVEAGKGLGTARQPTLLDVRHEYLKGLGLEKWKITWRLRSSSSETTSSRSTTGRCPH